MSSIDLAVSNDVAIVTIDRPPVNATDSATLLEIGDAFLSLSDRKDVRVAVFTGAGDRTFIGGADVKRIEGARSEPSLSEVLDRGYAGRRALWSIYDCAVPVIAAVNGHAVGGGVAFAAVCDMIVAADNAEFWTPEINVGMLGAFSQLSLLVGRHVARELFFTTDRISASELRAIGAIRRVVPREQLMDEALALAKRIAQKSPIAVRLAKQSMNRGEFHPLKEAYQIEQDYTARLLRYEDAAEARQAFMEKRPASWSWR
jgi:enoyl-CoA hydratase